MESNTSTHSSSGAFPVPTPELGTWNTREEARKFWDYIPCDDCVYFAKPFDVNGEIPHVFAEKYVRNDLWFHIRWTQVEPGQARDHCVEALIEAVHMDEPFHVSSKLDGPVSTVNGNSAVFVEVPEFVELPEMMCVYGIRSVARLKVVKSAVDARVEQSALLPVSLIGSANRENNFDGDLFGRGNCTGKQIDQVPSELIERSPKTINEISDGEGDFFVGGSRRDYENVLRSIRVVLFGDGIRVAFNPISKLFLSRLEVKVSPSGFHVDVLN